MAFAARASWHERHRRSYRRTIRRRRSTCRHHGAARGKGEAICSHARRRREFHPHRCQRRIRRRGDDCARRDDLWQARLPCEQCRQRLATWRNRRDRLPALRHRVRRPRQGTACRHERLAELGAIETLDDRGYRLPWTTRITFHWLQTFAPGVTVIEHSYRPILGFRLVTVDKGGAVIASGSEDTASAFCIDEAGKRTLRQLSERALARRQKEGGGADSYLFAYALGYVLQTARNWRGPIGMFNLTVNGGPIPMVGSTDTRMTGAVSFCSEVPVKQAAALRSEGMAPDFVPRQDLRILFVAE